MLVLPMLRLVPAFLLATLLTAQSPSTDVAVGVFPFLVGNMDARIGEIVTNCQTYGIDAASFRRSRRSGAGAGR